MINIPIYRAKKIDGNEWVDGYYTNNEYDGKHEILYAVSDEFETWFDHTEIDPNTLAIHFPNMIDKNGKKIFAGLCEDGIGGDDIKAKFFDIDGVAEVGVAEGTYNTKMSRLKGGSKYSITVSDFKGFMDLFGCTCADLFRDVDFNNGLETSNCCGASLLPETDICSECKEHCEIMKD